MNKQSLLIYNLPVLFNILNEIKENFKFSLYNFTKEEEILNADKNKFGNYLILTDHKSRLENYNNQIIVDKNPLKIDEIIQKINIALLKQNYNYQSKILIGEFQLDINSRKIYKNDKNLKLTEKETEIILFLKKSKEGQSIDRLQKEVWGHNASLETHTVETHIYRLRKKINDTFKNENFIISTKNGYKIL